MSKKGLKLCSAGLALSIMLSSAPFTIAAGALGLSIDGNVYDDNDRIMDGSYVAFTAPTAGYIGFFFGGKDADYLVLEDGTFEAVKADVVKGDVRFAVSFDKDGNVEMVQVRKAEVGSSEDFSYAVYTPKGATTGRYIDSVRTINSGSYVTKVTKKGDYYYTIGASEMTGYLMQDTVIEDDGFVIQGEYSYTISDETEKNNYFYEYDYVSNEAKLGSCTYDIKNGKAINRKEKSVTIRPGNMDSVWMTRAIAKNGNDEIEYVFSYSDDTRKKVNGGDPVALDDNDVYYVKGVYDKPTSIDDIVKVEEDKWMAYGGFKTLDTDYVTFTRSNWSVLLNGEGGIDGFDASKITSFEVTLKGLDKRFNGKLNGSIGIWHNGDGSGIKFYSNEYDYASIIPEKISDDTYKVTVATDESFYFAENTAYTSVSVSLSSKPHSDIEVSSVMFKDADGNVLVSYDNKGVINLPVSVKTSSSKKAVTVEWDKVPFAVKYEVETLNSDGEWEKAAETTDELSATFSNLKIGTYNYRVIAIDKNGDIIGTSESSEANVKTVIENVKATCKSSRTATITWDKVEGATSYKVTCDNGLIEYVKNISGNSCTVKGLINGEEYGFIVWANIDDEWVSSDAVYVTPVGTPKNVKAVCNSSRTVTLTWDKVDGATKYVVKSADGKTTYKSTKNNTYTVTGLTNGVKYQFKVYAYVDGHWYGSAVKSKTPVGTPKNVKAVCNASRTVTLTWDKVAGATKYVVKTADGKTTYKSTKNNTYTVTGLTNGTKYTFKVYAYVDGKWYASAKVTKTPTGTPKNVKAVCNSSKTVTLTWDKVAGATKYVVKTADGKTTYKSTKNNTYTVTGLTNGTKYTFKVYAYVDGKWYASAKVTKTPTGMPKNVKAVCNSSRTITLTWDKVAGATKYVVKSADGKTTYKSTKNNTYTVTGLTNGTKYTFKVYAYVDGKWYASAKVTKTPAGTPKNVKAVSKTSKTVTLTWDKVEGATGYMVKSADGKTKYTSKSIKDTTYTVKNLTGGKQYKFKVYAYVDGKWYASAKVTKTAKK